MAATFVVEDGTGKSDANSLMTIVEADQVIENYGNDSSWSGADNDTKEYALREATRYLNVHYSWKGYRHTTTQALQWPREWCYDDEGNYLESDAIPDKIKEACAYLALKVVLGDTLLEDFTNEAAVKRTKDVIGPLTEEIEYAGIGEEPDKTYQVADKLVAPYTAYSGNISDLYRA